ncbi:hypothetical protein AN958_11187 [Leucoagaricus sp. SymC.cos]|nr:hypothetical protein AN958_11187 [Leucoagaricus sp. SymC.cos]
MPPHATLLSTSLLLHWALANCICFVCFIVYVYTAIPPCAMSAIQRLDYVSYASITLMNCCRATFTPMFESPIIAELLSLLAKPIDRSDDRNISMQDWCSIAAAVEHEANALQHHHQNVIGILQVHSWQIAVDYNIQQRELAYMDKRHDYSTLNGNTILLIMTKTEDIMALSASPEKQHGINCFQCGLTGHLPANCTALVTTAGKLPAPLLLNARSPQSLQAPNSSQFCFTFTSQNSCRFGSACSFVHACSLCGGSLHDAGSC